MAGSSKDQIKEKLDALAQNMKDISHLIDDAAKETSQELSKHFKTKVINKFGSQLPTEELNCSNYKLFITAPYKFSEIILLIAIIKRTTRYY